MNLNNNVLVSNEPNSIYNCYDEASLSDNIFHFKDFNLSKGDFDFNNNLSENSENNNDLNNFNNITKISFKKNRNYFNNNSLILKNKENNNNINQDINNNIKKYIRCDSLLIKFKSTLGKWYIKMINQKLKSLKEKHILKRLIKLYSFNYKKFTLNVSYSKNKKWLDYKIKDLLILGDEENKNIKSLKSLFKKKLEELNDVKDMLELSYRDVIEKFYCFYDEFNKFKNNERVKELDDNFKKIMNISILEKNGFIEFLETRKGNNKRKEGIK